MIKTLPFDDKIIISAVEKFGSPIYLYDESGIVGHAEQLNLAFAWVKNYKNFFAVKATPTPGILNILHDQGMGFDCSSRAELATMQKMGIHGQDIFYTSNNTPKEDFELAIELGATVNIDDLTQIPVFIEALGSKGFERVSIRFNPGNKQSGNEIIGKPLEAKYGVRHDQLISAYQMLSKANVKSFGLHIMVASNELDPSYFGITAKLLKEAVELIEKETDVKISFLNLGGGFGLNYKPEEEPINLHLVSENIRNELADFDGEIYTENGRFVTGPHGYLVTRVQYVMDKYKKYVGVDASMHNLMRPGMYGAYHHITVLGKGDFGNQIYDIVGALCENNDKFAIDRKLPLVGPDDIVVIHDAGAHGHSMGFNYNGLLRSSEVLVKSSGELVEIRRAETLDDYFRTIVW